jgi:GNAT superfamily N-acetyltransferase
MTATKPRPEMTNIRHARPEEAETISELAVHSKGHWGYDAAFLESCREDLALSPQDIATSTVYVLEGRDGIAGYYRLMPLEKGAADLDALFVDPSAIGHGVGRRLWEHAIATASALGFTALDIQSDPHAEGFYLAMGAHRIGESESTVTPGRMLPQLRFALESEDEPC